MNSEEKYPEKIKTISKLFFNYKGGRSGKSVIVVDILDRKLFFYPKEINLNRAGILWIKTDHSLD